MTDVFIVPSTPGRNGASAHAFSLDESTPASPAPLVGLDPAGTSTPLSYDVPEPVAYSGRNFITLEVPTDAFRIPAADPEQVYALHASAVATSTTRTQTSRAARADDALFATPGPAARTRRAATLTVAQARDLEEAGQKPVLVTNSAGLLDVRLSPATPASPGVTAGSHGAALFSGPAARPALLPGGPTGPADPGEPPPPPDVDIVLQTPGNNSTAQGSAQGVNLTAGGRWTADRVPTVQVFLDGVELPADEAKNITVNKDGSWSAPLVISTAGTHTLLVVATLDGGLYNGKPIRGVDRASATFTVVLTPEQVPPPVLPQISVELPRTGGVLAAPEGHADVVVSGRASIPTGEKLTVTVSDVTTGANSASADVGGDGTYSATLKTVLGLGTHLLRVVATSASGTTSPALTVPVVLSIRPPMARITNRLMIVETLNLTSFLGDYGAGRCLKTFSLLPGETTTLSTKSYRSDTTTISDSSSILDSAASEASSDFDDTVTAEQTDKTALSQSNQFSIGASVGAHWGFGSASVNAQYSGAANSAREEAVKNVSTATQKHAAKASSNRTVTVNTETASALTSTDDDSTVRQVKNINVGRTLNFVFRQMNQEHVVLYHLTNARVGYYTEDLELDSNGKVALDADKNQIVHTDYQEVSLPELNSLLNTTVDPAYAQKIRDAVVNALSGIPDYTDTLRSLVETATPTDSTGTPVLEAAYLRVVRGLHTDFKDPGGDFTVTVPGIVLSYDRVVQRTDGIFVDAILGQGDALDAYSHGLQDAAVADKAAQVARAQLAASLVSSHDDSGAGIYAKVFPPAPAPVVVGWPPATEQDQ